MNNSKIEWKNINDFIEGEGFFDVFRIWNDGSYYYISSIYRELKRKFNKIEEAKFLCELIDNSDIKYSNRKEIEDWHYKDNQWSKKYEHNIKASIVNINNKYSWSVSLNSSVKMEKSDCLDKAKSDCDASAKKFLKESNII